MEKAEVSLLLNLEKKHLPTQNRTVLPNLLCHFCTADSGHFHYNLSHQSYADFSKVNTSRWVSC